MACTTMTTVTTKVRPKTIHISMCRQAPPGLPLLVSLPSLPSALLMGGIVTPAEWKATPGGKLALSRRMQPTSAQVRKENAALRNTGRLGCSRPFREGAAKVGLALMALLHGCVADGNRPMQLVHEVGPAYPQAAKAAGAEGWVKVRYDVTADGLVENLAVVESNPSGLFDAAALAAVAQWRYRPAVVDGAPRRMRGVVSTLRFQLDGGERYDPY